ncbi:alpha-L-arabinofuranosidase [Aspergillus heteromorphus CBS 117.55]|uniref:non-reducing end alpha-L-arabinofuranosidase n=1 Tax=Aspergillus heteromorphus CBS 117.55 TaxID=1448321 RepID=A0A317WLX6_9EURO|nr:alpha-L-arabinofuranosidase [Aspergillus heteromorphus CBS 117.55]PWY87393.1 alpha-L-arabinofuranosidase [Aspergillus heteromorphus CBS 117.55]
MKGLATWLAVALAAGLPGLVSGERLAKRDSSSTVTLTVNPSGGNASSPLLYGIMFEDMDHSGDGGIHGQLLQNNGFQGDNPGLTAYESIGDVTIAQDMDHPVSDAIHSSLQVAVNANATGFVGFANTGYDGVPVMKTTYLCEFWMLGNYSGNITLQLVGSSSGKVYASHNMTVVSSEEFTNHQTTFNSSASSDGNNEWRLLFDSALVPNGTLNFGLVQLFPPTFNTRSNGLREDVATFVDDIKPSFLRFPGGNNLEGLQIDTRWQWNLTIGPVVDRPGRESDWFYPNTDALGLDEYLWWCEDMNMEPVLAVWDGKSYGGILSGTDLQPYVDDILNELEYLLGPSNSTYGSLRAQNGRKDPWPVNYIEIGNEDDLTGGCDTYPDRFTQIYDAINGSYPNITLIASTITESCLPSDPPAGVVYDYHYYREPDALVAMFNLWDNQPRSQPVMVGEYGCRNTSATDGVFWSSILCSCSEAVHMIGLERNSDVVRMAAYAPLLQHFGYTSWSPTLFGFDSSPDSLTPGTSYYVQQMFSANRGTTILPVDTDADFGPVYWVASKNNTAYIVKLANYGAEKKTVHVNVPNTTTGVLERLSGSEYATNQPHEIKVRPNSKTVTSSQGNYTIHMDPWGVAVLSVTSGATALHFSLGAIIAWQICIFLPQLL